MKKISVLLVIAGICDISAAAPDFERFYQYYDESPIYTKPVSTFRFHATMPSGEDIPLGLPAIAHQRLSTDELKTLNSLLDKSRVTVQNPTTGYLTTKVDISKLSAAERRLYRKLVKKIEG